MKIDSHLHFWNLSIREQEWMIGHEFDLINRNFDMSDLQEDLEKSNVDHAILVQTVSVPEETGEFLSLAAATPKIAGVVGWVDMEKQDITQNIESHLLHPNSNYLVGIRDLAQFKSDNNWLINTNVSKNIKRLSNYDLVYDLLITPNQLPAAVNLVRDTPDVNFVLDHIAKPNISEGHNENWSVLMKKLSQSPNVVVKISGMITQTNWGNWSEEEFYPYIELIAKYFGPNRMMFGSDWPVCLLSGSYQQVVTVVESAISNWSELEKEMIWSSTAIRAYGLNL